MATYTEKLGLKMPAQTDFYNVDDFNENFRKIDESMAMDADIKKDIQQVLTLADPIRSNRAPTTADTQYAGKLWVVPKMIFNNMMPNALAQATANWKATAATVSVSGTAVTLVGSGAASTIVGEVDMTAVKANDIVYIAAKMAVTTDANGAVLELLCGGEVIATASMSVPVAGDNIRLIGHTKVDAAGALKLRVTTMYNSASAQLGKGVTVSDITILDLTADMCQNFAGIEFSKDAATTYIDTYGNFQTKTYELSEYWWICRGSYSGQYSWQRYDDYTNAVMNEYSTNYQNSKATTAEAQAGTNDTHWMTPLKTQQFLTNKIATQAEAEAGSVDTKVMTPLKTKQQIFKEITSVDGMAFGASADIHHYATCSTAAGTAAKVASTGQTGFKLIKGAKVVVRFTYANTANTITLNVDSTGAKNVYFLNSTTATAKWFAYSTIEFVYDGTNWYATNNGSIFAQVSLTTAGWAADSTYGGYSQTITTVATVPADAVHIGLQQSDDASAATLQRESFSQITRCIVGSNSLKFLCAYAKPTVALTCNVEVRR